MKKIKLVEEAYLRNGEYRQGIFALNEWYQAAAEDEDGNQYTVIWKIKEDYNAEIMDEDAACDWVEPWNVSNEDGENVTDEVIIIN